MRKEILVTELYYEVCWFRHLHLRASGETNKLQKYFCYKFSHDYWWFRYALRNERLGLLNHRGIFLRKLIMPLP